MLVLSYSICVALVMAGVATPSAIANRNGQPVLIGVFESSAGSLEELADELFMDFSCLLEANPSYSNLTAGQLLEIPFSCCGAACNGPLCCKRNECGGETSTTARRAAGSSTTSCIIVNTSKSSSRASSTVSRTCSEEGGTHPGSTFEHSTTSTYVSSHGPSLTSGASSFTTSNLSRSTPSVSSSCVEITKSLTRSVSTIVSLSSTVSSTSAPISTKRVISGATPIPSIRSSSRSLSSHFSSTQSSAFESSFSSSNVPTASANTLLSNAASSSFFSTNIPTASANTLLSTMASTSSSSTDFLTASGNTFLSTTASSSSSSTNVPTASGNTLLSTMASVSMTSATHSSATSMTRVSVASTASSTVLSLPNLPTLSTGIQVPSGSSCVATAIQTDCGAGPNPGQLACVTKPICASLVPTSASSSLPANPTGQVYIDIFTDSDCINVLEKAQLNSIGQCYSPTDSTGNPITFGCFSVTYVSQVADVSASLAAYKDGGCFSDGPSDCKVYPNLTAIDYGNETPFVMGSLSLESAGK